ncbi:MAG: rhomboid family intramembrane serine protease [Desulfobulbus sp.]|jgi:membrane associated rhomboid family serine protease|nr:MAG: rhomboid family intramembrane serine protease [Desulfobulbus sp.]
MFPLRDDNPTIHTSFATFTIIALNIVAWVFLQGLGAPGPLAQSICEFGLIPGELLGRLAAQTLIPLGPGMYCQTSADPNWLTPVTSMFMHGGWLHLILNMWFLYIFGDNVEDAMGIPRFVVFYLLCGLGAVAAQMLSDPASAIPMVGASGAIGGVMGGYALLFPRAPVHMLVFLGFFFFRIVVPAYFMLGYWFLLQLISALPTIGNTAGGVAFWAHVGGFATGLLLVRIFCKTGRLDVCRARRGQAAGFIERVR